MNYFSDFPLAKSLQNSLTRLGFTQPTPVQAKVIPLLLETTTDLHAQAATGTGKTLAFGIPLLQKIDPTQKTVQALIVAPTRELVRQIYESLQAVAQETDILLAPIYGGMPIDRQIAAIKQGAQIIIGTPGRLNDHLRRKTLSLNNLNVLVLDEADIMLDMGFKEEIDEILKKAPSGRQIWLFSATVRPGIKRLISSHMHNVVSIKTETEQKAHAHIEQYYCVAPARKRLDIAARFIEATPNFYGILFCRTKALTQEVMEKLASKGFNVNCLHGDMKQTVRNQIIKGFKRKDFTILIATDVAARGIDVADLTHVINYSLPEDRESYVHRIGRTGRAGKKGIAISLINASERYRIKQLEKIAKSTINETPIPSVKDIIHIKIEAASDFIEQAKQPISENLSPIHQELHTLIATFSEQEIRNALAIALEERFFKGMTDEEIKIEPERDATLHERKELCLERGKDDGLTEKSLRFHVQSVCKLSPQDIKKIRILNKRSFIAVPEDKINSCLNALRDNPIAKKARIFIVRDVPQRDQRSRPDKQGFQKRERRYDDKKKRMKRRRPNKI